MNTDQHGCLRTAAVVADPAAARGAFGHAATGAPHTVALRVFTLALWALVCGGAHLCEAQATDNKNILWSVDWSSDGKFFAVGGAWTGIFDAKTQLRHAAPALDSLKAIAKVRWHPRRQLLAISGGADGATAIYDVAAGRKVELNIKEGTRGISWNPTGERLATAGGDGALQIWQADGKLLRTTKPPKAKSLTGVAWHPKEDKIVTVGEFITLQDGNGKTLKQVSHRPEARGMILLLCVEWHPSGEFFVVGDYGNKDTGDAPTLQWWSSEGSLLKSVEVAGKAPLRNVSWSTDGSLLASASDALRIWSKDGALQHVGKSPDLLWGIRWNRAGTWLLTSSHEGRVTLWSATAESLKSVVEAPNCAPGVKPKNP